ncbi:MAG: DUF2066 domain-containing protein [Rhodospirillales bacterium]|nr:DUF2066 domain-containing protein [Rhodospirillales bacterium]
MIHHPQVPHLTSSLSTTVKLLRIPAFILALLLGPSGPAWGQIANVFEVRNVAVDVTSETAAAAREQALAEGEIKAFRRLLNRMTLLEDRNRLPDLSREEITPYVQGFSVSEEKTSPVRYLAKLNYLFKDDKIRELLNGNSLPFAETPSKPLLILPVYQAAGALLLWDDPNPWREAWQARPPLDGMVPQILPIGDLSDIATIGVEQAVEGDLQRLTAIAKRYGTGDAMVARGILRMAPGDRRNELDVYIVRYGAARQNTPIVKKFVSAPEEPLNNLLKRAAISLSLEIENNWKKDNLLQFGHPAVIAVKVPIKSLNEWLKVRNNLGRVAVIRRLDLVLLARDEAHVNLHFIGETEQLAVALEQADLYLAQEEGTWTLKTTRPPPASNP